MNVNIKYPGRLRKATCSRSNGVKLQADTDGLSAV